MNLTTIQKANPDGFKDSEIGKIPEAWEVVRLGDEHVAALIMGQSPPSSTYNDKGAGLPFLQGNADFGETYPVPTLSCSQPTKISEKNDILLSVRAPVGDININPAKSCIGRGLAAIRPKSDTLNYLFLYYYLKFASRKFESLSMGSTFKAIRKTEVENFQILLPPLPEQRAIASILGTVDEAIQKVNEAIEKTGRLKRGLMQTLLTKGIGHKKFKFSKDLGCDIPDDWEMAMLGDIADIKGGKRLPNGHSLLDAHTAHPYIRVVDFENMGVDVENLKYLSPETYQHIRNYTISRDDVYISIAGTIGVVGIIPPELDGANLTENAAKLCNFKKINKTFFAYTLSSKIAKRQIDVLVGKATQPKLALFRIEKIKIPLPPLPEQHRIAEILGTVDHKLELERARKGKLERVKAGLMNELLTGRKRVKL